jgi:hypothetical protein
LGIHASASLEFSGRGHKEAASLLRSIKEKGTLRNTAPISARPKRDKTFIDKTGPVKTGQTVFAAFARQRAISSPVPGLSVCTEIAVD